MDKATLRQQIRAQRRALPIELRKHYNQAICSRAITFINTHNFEKIGLYLAQDGEVDLSGLIDWLWQENKNCYLPTLGQDKVMRFVAYHRHSELKNNRYGIKEPTGEAFAACELDLIIAPLVGFDQYGHRLGMGGGFYDATLKALNIPFIGCAYHLQQVPQLMSDPWDRSLDYIITENDLLSFKKP